MKPIKLKIKGFNSFTEEQTINFKGLTEKGIFGIFGPTGSGKSSIIDAMTFALYGNAARYENEERRAFINVNTNSLTVVFEFSLTSAETVFYEVSREIKKNKSGSVSHNARLIRRIGDNIDIVAEKAKSVTENIIKIIGLDYKDFIRSVVLPQGKFSEFLMLKNAERRNMLERIFGLEKYGTRLNEAINEKRKKQMKKLDDIKSKLEVFGDVSKEEIIKLKDELSKKNDCFEKQRKLIEEKRDIFEKCKAFVDLKKEFDEYLIMEEKLKKQKDDIILKKIKVDDGKKAEKVYPFILEYKKSLENYDNAVLKAKDAENQFKSAENEFLTQKNKYEKFLSDKKNRYPLIIKKETELMRAVEIKKVIDEAKGERQKFLAEYKTVKTKLSKVKDKYEKETEEKTAAEKTIADIEKEKERIVVSPDYRKNIEYAYNTEKNFSELNMKYNLENDENKKLSENIEKEKAEVNDNKKAVEILEEKIEALIKERKDFSEKNIYSLSDIIEKQKENEDAGNLFYSKKEKYDRCLKLKEDLLMLEKEKKAYDDKLKDILTEEENNNKELADIEEKIKLIESKELIAELVLKLKDDKPCPVCGSIHHPMPAKEVFDETSEELNVLRNNVKDSLSHLSEEKNDVSAKSAVIVSDMRKMKDELGIIEKDLENFEYEKEKEKRDKENNNFEKIKKDFEFYTEEIKKLDEKEKEFTSELNKLRAESIRLESELKKDYENFDKSCKILKELSEKKISSENELNDLRKTFEIDDFQKEYVKLIDFEKQKSALEKKEKENRVIFEEKQKSIDELKSEINGYERDIEKIKILGKEKKRIIEENSKKFEEILEGKELDKYIEEISQEKSFFDENEALFKEKTDKIEILKNAAYENKIREEKERDTFKKINFDMKKSLETVVSENGFENGEQAEKAYIGKEEILALEKEINDYSDKEKDISFNIKKISMKIEKSDIFCDVEELEKRKKEIEQINDDIEKVIGETGRIKNKITETENNLLKVDELKKQEKVQRHKLDIITELFNTMKGGRFVEYIAKRQLYYVTADASERLKKMTDGRYAIELDGENLEQDDIKNCESADFVIRDDFNGGVRRTPKSLSGGEIFLTSLSLALALSGKIQLKNNAPLETFFLDEGFGTLDVRLLDIVMDSLEKLTLEKISVGVITHIEEIKNRIQSKIIVEPDDGVRGTRIKME